MPVRRRIFTALFTSVHCPPRMLSRAQQAYTLPVVIWRKILRCSSGTSAHHCTALQPCYQCIASHCIAATVVRHSSCSDELRQTLQADWGLLGLGVDDVRVRLLPDVVAEQAEMFLINGDMQSNLYTSSRAMHSAILGLLQVQPLYL